MIHKRDVTVHVSVIFVPTWMMDKTDVSCMSHLSGGVCVAWAGEHCLCAAAGGEAVTCHTPCCLLASHFVISVLREGSFLPRRLGELPLREDEGDNIIARTLTLFPMKSVESSSLAGLTLQSDHRHESNMFTQFPYQPCLFSCTDMHVYKPLQFSKKQCICVVVRAETPPPPPPPPPPSRPVRGGLEKSFPMPHRQLRRLRGEGRTNMYTIFFDADVVVKLRSLVYVGRGSRRGRVCVCVCCSSYMTRTDILTGFLLIAVVRVWKFSLSHA